MHFIEKEGTKIAQVKEVQIKKYQIELNEKGYSNHSVARKMSSLRLFFKYLRKEGVMIHNPMEEIKQPILENKKISLTIEEKEKLKEKMKQNERDYLLYHLVCIEKIKPTEAIQIQWQQINLSQGILYLKKKAISLSKETRECILSIEKKENEDYLLKSQNKQILTESGVYFILKTYLKEIGKGEIRPIDLSL